MAYTVKNYPTKRAVREAVDRGEAVRVYQPGPLGPDVPDGVCFLEGPHAPKPHMWYAVVTVEDGVIVKIS